MNAGGGTGSDKPVWIYRNYRWIKPGAAPDPPKAFFNERIREIAQKLQHKDTYAALFTDASPTSDHSIAWNQPLTLALLRIVELIGTQWPVVFDRMKALICAENEEGVVDEELTVAPDVSLRFFKRMSHENLARDRFYCEVKDRFYFVLRRILSNADKYKYSGLADAARLRNLDSRNQVTMDAFEAHVRDIVLRLQSIVCTKPVDYASVNSRLNSNIEQARSLHSVVLEETGDHVICDFLPYKNAADCVSKSRGAVLFSSLISNTMDSILQAYKSQAKNSWLMNAGKDYHAAVTKVLLNARDSFDTDLFGFSATDSSELTLQKYFADAKFTPPVSSYECFVAYFELFNEVCLAVNIERQLKHVNQMINQWNAKLIELRRCLRGNRRVPRTLNTGSGAKQ